MHRILCLQNVPSLNAFTGFVLLFEVLKFIGNKMARKDGPLEL